MGICIQELFVHELDGEAARKILAEWTWLLDRPMRPINMTAFGDWFLEAKDDGSVHFLDAGIGQVKQVAASRAEWRQALLSRDNRQEWLLAGQLVSLREAGSERTFGRCYSYRIPPSLGGGLELDNFELTDVHLHQRFTSCAAKRVQGLPPGTPITEEMVQEIAAAVYGEDAAAPIGPRIFRLAAAAAVAVFALSLAL